MWTAKLIRKRIVDGRLLVSVEYTNGTEVYKKIHTLNRDRGANWLRREARDEIQRLKEVYAFADTLTEGTDIDTNIVDTPPVSSEPAL